MSVYACPDHKDAESTEPGSCPMYSCGKTMVQAERPIVKAARVDEKTKALEIDLAGDRMLKLSDVRTVVEKSAGKIDDAAMTLTGRVLIHVSPGADAPCPMETCASVKAIRGVKSCGPVWSEDKKTLSLLIEADGASLSDLRRALDGTPFKTTDVEWGQAAQDARARDCTGCKEK